MSWWIIVYIGVFILLSAAGLWDDYCDRRPVWSLVCALLANLTVAYLFVTFWHTSLRSPVGIVAPTAFVASMCWEAFQAIKEILDLPADPELTAKQQRAVVALTTVALIVLCVPVFIVAGISAFRP
jgi:hypothetical protein